MRKEGQRGGSEEVQARAASGFDDRRNVILRISSPCREHSSMTSAESRKEINERGDWRGRKRLLSFNGMQIFSSEIPDADCCFILITKNAFYSKITAYFSCILECTFFMISSSFFIEISLSRSTLRRNENAVVQSQSIASQGRSGKERGIWEWKTD